MTRGLLLLMVTALCLCPICAFALDENADDESGKVFTEGEVIVSGNRSPAEITSSVQVITEADIKALGAKNVAQALAIASGTRIDTAPTSISANGKGEFLAGLRGYDPRNVIILIDGIPVYEPYFRVLDLRQIPVGDIAKIKIIKGPTSVLYGPNALGGVINIITKKGAGKPRAHLEGSYGDVEKYSGSGSVLGGHKGAQYFFSPGYEKSDGYPVSDDFSKTRNEDGALRENSDYTDYYLSGKGGYDKGLFGLTLTASHYEYIGGVPYSMEAVEPATLWRKNWRKTSAAFYGQVGVGDFFQMKGSGFFTRFYNTITTYSDTTLSAVLEDGDAVSTYDNYVTGYVLMPRFFFGKAGDLTLSMIYKLDDVSIADTVGENWNEYGAETYSGGAQYELQVSKFSFTAGSAYHFYRKTKTPGDVLGEDVGAADYQAGVAFTPISAVEIFTAGARKSSFPDLKTLYGSSGNPDLKPEFAYNVDAGIRLSPLKPLNLDSTYFYSDITDLIGKKDTGNEFTYENIDKATIQGVESALRLSFFKGMLSFYANHTYMKTRDDQAGRKLKSLDFRPENTAAVDARAALPFGTVLSVQYFYIGERKYEQPGASQNIATLPEYGLVNMRFGQTFKWDDAQTAFEVFVEGKNLLDVYYEQSPEKAAPGRELTAGLSFDF